MAFEFFGGVAQIVAPDNLKTSVKKPCYYEPDLNPPYREMGAHYEVVSAVSRTSTSW